MNAVAHWTGERIHDRTVAFEDPSDAAYRAARRKLRTLERLPDDIFKQKLGQFLLRQGFDYEVARSVTRRLLAERETERTT